ncbi:hypothetical protein BU17DRAFT_104162 [Hysterangium stoloniferum]|nr:hypothetical protein BU17DRAFT_104162 [Hysterangium stoloniferum]
MSKLRKTRASTDGHLPPTYYLDNFKHFRRYDTGNGLVTDLPVYRSDKIVAEFQGDKYQHCDHFVVDIYYTGHVIKTEFFDTRLTTCNVTSMPNNHKGKYTVRFVSPLGTDGPRIGEVVDRSDPMRPNPKSAEILHGAEERKAGIFDLTSSPGNRSGWDTSSKGLPPVIADATARERRQNVVEAGSEKLVAAPDSEDFWTTNRLLFKYLGYKLHQPGRKQNKTKNHLNSPAIMAATRISNGAVVQLKKISLSKHGNEITASVVEVIKIPKDESIVVLVFPNFLSLRDAKFETRDDIMEFLGQIFEELHLEQHQGGASPKAPKMSKLRKTGASTDGHLPPKYYLDNFEHSRRYDTANWLFRGYKYHKPCDPFAIDICYIGHMIKMEFIDVRLTSRNITTMSNNHKRKRNVDFMLALVTDMVQENPAARPTIGEVVERFDHMRLNLKSAEILNAEELKYTIRRSWLRRLWLRRFRPFRRTVSRAPHDYLDVDTENGWTAQRVGPREVAVFIPSSAQLPPPMSKPSISIFGSIAHFFRGLSSLRQANRDEVSRKPIYNRPPRTYIIDVPAPPNIVVHLRTGRSDKWDCRKCGEHLNTSRQFLRHTRSEHPDAYICGCAKLYDNASDLRFHRNDFCHWD